MADQPVQSARSPIARCASCDWTHTTVDRTRALSALWLHDETQHRGRQAEVRQFPTVTFHAQALAAIRTLALTGKPFTIGEARALVTIAPLNPQTEWPAVTRQAAHDGLIEKVGYSESVVPTTKASAVAVWRGTAKARAA